MCPSHLYAFLSLVGIIPTHTASTQMLLLAGLFAACHAPGLTVGIDLGTTNSAVAILRDGSPELVKNRHGQTTTPSAVAFLTDGKVVVGDEAVTQSSQNVQNTVLAAKRYIGRSIEAVRQNAAGMGFKFVDDGDGGILFELPELSSPISPEECSAHILSNLLDDAEQATGRRATRAVITVPAYFTDRQRRSTRAAAALAGLDDVMLLAEPVAACLAHGLTGATGTVLVFDLGAGTFDVSVLRISEGGSVEVVATSGDPRLGGNDFDSALLRWLADESDELGIHVRDDPSAMRQLAEACEAAKKRLSVVSSVSVPLPSADVARHGDSPSVTLSRKQLEVLCDTLLRRLKLPLYEVALSARVTLPGELNPDHGKVVRKLNAKKRRALSKVRPEGRQNYLPTGAPIDEVILVGGATHMVAVRRLVSNVFGVDPRRTVDPMHAVALGAAVQAGVLSGEVSGVRVLQSWQAQLSRWLGDGDATPGFESRDGGDGAGSLRSASEEGGTAEEELKEEDDAHLDELVAKWMAKYAEEDNQAK
jgi:molecular chaperone DnaK